MFAEIKGDGLPEGTEKWVRDSGETQARFYAVLIADGYCYGVSDNAHARNRGYWFPAGLEEGTKYAWLYIFDIPEADAIELRRMYEAHDYSDGYDLTRKIAHYLDDDPDEEWE